VNPAGGGGTETGGGGTAGGQHGGGGQHGRAAIVADVPRQQYLPQHPVAAKALARTSPAQTWRINMDGLLLPG
jgi:hypothetical protein